MAGKTKAKAGLVHRRSYEPTADKPLAITPVEYGGLQEGFDHFNRELFSGKLPDVFITYQRKAGMTGHFAADRYSGRIGTFGKHELALNPDAFISQTDKQICQTLVHEMTHVWHIRQAIRARLSQQRMGCDDEGHWPAAIEYRDGRRQGNRPTHDGLHHPRRQVRAGVRQARHDRLAVDLAVRASARRTEGAEKQGEVHLRGVRPECVGESRTRACFACSVSPSLPSVWALRSMCAR